MQAHIFLILLATLFGASMKVADLCDEHGLRLFKHDTFVFGLLWGLFGSLLTYQDAAIATAILAMHVAFIVRNRLDCQSHRNAGTIIIATGVVMGSARPIAFIIFLVIFAMFGAMKDDLKPNKLGMYMWDTNDPYLRGLYWLTEPMLYYPIPTFVYCLIDGDWLLFGVFTVYTVAYDITKAVAKRCGYP